MSITNNADIFAMYKVLWYKYNASSGKYVYIDSSYSVRVNPGETKEAPFNNPGGDGQYKSALVSGWNVNTFPTWDDLVAADTATDDIVQLWDGGAKTMQDGVAVTADSLTFDNAVITNQRYITKPASNISVQDTYTQGELVPVTGHIGLDDGYTGRLTGMNVDSLHESAFMVQGISINGEYYQVETEGEKRGNVERKSEIFLW